MFKIATYILGAGLMFSASAAFAGDLPPDVIEGVMRTCRPDYHRICSLVVPGEGRVARCLLDHEDELTPPCLKELKTAYAIQACMPDYNRFCGGVPRGAEALECLAGRIEALQPECSRIVSANAPYIEPRGDRYTYNRGPVPYGRDYAYSYRPREGDPYYDRDEPRFRSYDDRGYSRPDSYNGPMDGEGEEDREQAK